MKIELRKYLQYVVLAVLYLGAIQPGYAHDYEGAGLKKEAIVAGKIKPWEKNFKK